MMFIFQIDGSTVPVYNKPRIQLASRDSYAIFQYTARALTLSILNTVSISSASRLKVYQDSVATANLIWTGDIDWNSRKSDSKSTLIEVTFNPDQAMLNTTQISQAFASKDFEDVMDFIVAELGAGWSWEANFPLTQIYTYTEEKLAEDYSPNPMSTGSEIDFPDPFYVKPTLDPYIKFWYNPYSTYLYSRMREGGFGSGGSLPLDYTHLAAPADVSTPISGNVGYGYDYDDAGYWLFHHIYFVRDNGIWSYGPQTLIINQFSVTYDSTADSIVKDLCQLADAYVYVLDKKIYLVHRHEAQTVSITGSVISRKTSYSQVDLSISLSVDYGILQTKLNALDAYYVDHYGSNRVIENLVVINPSARVLPGDKLVLNGVLEGTVKGVSYGSDRMSLDLDRMGLD